MRQGAERQWMPRATRWVAVLVGTVVSVGACTGGEADPAPSLTTPVATSTQPTASPSPTPTAPAEPAKPASWTTGSDEAAVEAAAYFMDLYNYVRATGDLAEWDALSDQGCEFCAGTRTLAEETYGTGGWLEQSDVTVTEGTLAGFDTTFRVHGVEVGYSVPEVREYDASGALIATYTPERGRLLLEVGFTGTGWRLVGATARDVASDA